MNISLSYLLYFFKKCNHATRSLLVEMQEPKNWYHTGLRAKPDDIKTIDVCVVRK